MADREKLIGFDGMSILITGVCGTIGAELLRQCLFTSAARIVGIDNNESELFFMQHECGADPRVSLFLSDIRDQTALSLRMSGIDVVFHAAALKHVGLCEESPTQAVQTNIDGTQNVIEACVANGVGRMIFTSSDKAVNPTNVMGTSKLMGERLTTAASQSVGGKTVFASTRFGNVLGSRGSVVPLFHRQIESGGPITLTDRRMTRFVMTLEQAVELVLASSLRAEGGEVFVTKMPVARIEDVATAMRSLLGGAASIPIKEIGAKPGEKMYEELMNDEEVRRAYELDDFFVILPPFLEVPYGYVRAASQPTHAYSSDSLDEMSVSEVETLLAREVLKLG